MQLRKNVPVIDNKIEIGEDMEFEDEWHHNTEQEALLDKLEVAIKELNDEQRTCIELFYLHKKTYTEITVDTNYTMMQVKSAIQNGKRNLKLKLEAQRNVKT
jgi:RNA polymerase sigma-70 factor (ECF subfamily)